MSILTKDCHSESSEESPARHTTTPHPSYPDPSASYRVTWSEESLIGDLVMQRPFFTGTVRVEAFPRLLGLFLRSGSIKPRSRLQGVCKCGVVCVFKIGP